MSTITAPEPHATPAPADSSPRRAQRLGGYLAPDTGQTREIEELARGDSSATVLNRRLREAVQRRVVRGELSMSEIARRCGRTRSGKPCNHGGEASWLARRIGEQAESGEAAPSPWVNSDILALIAREGLGLSPHEVEL